MTTPIIDRFCCASKENDVPYELLLNFRAKPYSIVSLVSALISACGCLYQESFFGQYHGLSKKIYSIQVGTTTVNFMEVCYVRYVRYTSVYVILSVSSSLILIFIAMGVIYFPSIHRNYQPRLPKVHGINIISKKCRFGIWDLGTFSTDTIYHDVDFRCSTKPFNLFVNNFCIYFPILLTMIVNPILYIKSSKEVREVLQTSFGKWTDNEMKIHKQVTEKFLYIVIVFYVCWIPNIINVCVMFWYSDVHPNVILVLWFISAILNPQQALLNALVYRGIQRPDNLRCCNRICTCCPGPVDGLRLMHRFNTNRSNTTREHQEDIFEEGQPLLTSSSQFTTSTPS
ncbi:G-protein coupled receptor 143 [Nymphon striatum]|nr:G-protein coupled receptor 143 [Nymphon striatum]